MPLNEGSARDVFASAVRDGWQFIYNLPAMYPFVFRNKAGPNAMQKGGVGGEIIEFRDSQDNVIIRIDDRGIVSRKAFTGTVGEIRFGAWTATYFTDTLLPLGWMECRGQVLNVGDYPDLFAAIGNQYGGDGVATFALPNFDDKSLVGRSTTHVVGASYGNATFSILDHTHTHPHSHGIVHTHTYSHTHGIGFSHTHTHTHTHGLNGHLHSMQGHVHRTALTHGHSANDQQTQGSVVATSGFGGTGEVQMIYQVGGGTERYHAHAFNPSVIDYTNTGQASGGPVDGGGSAIVYTAGPTDSGGGGTAVNSSGVVAGDTWSQSASSGTSDTPSAGTWTLVAGTTGVSDNDATSTQTHQGGLNPSDPAGAITNQSLYHPVVVVRAIIQT